MRIPLGLVFVCCLVVHADRASAQSVSMLYGFHGADGAIPVAGLVANAGAVYGTTVTGGIGFGTVFSLTSGPGGAVRETVVHQFTGGADGQGPSASLTSVDGVLYGTTANGGTKGFGTVFQLTPPVSGGAWIKTTLYNFQSGTDGRGPFSNVIFGSRGNLYGTTTYGGNTLCAGGQGCGTVFQLTPLAGGTWQETVLHRFRDGEDGANPTAGVVIGSDGTLYGTTSSGGMFGFGTVFALIRPAVLGGTWSEKILYSFAGGGDGEQPLGGLALSANGDLFGTTTGGGSSGCGTVFAMTPQAGGAWEKSILHSFRCDDGAYPESALLLWPGYVFGTASGGGPGNSGSVFILKAPAVSGNAWTSGFHSLNASTNGANPVGNLIWGRDGAVLGTAMNGGPSGQGTVFRVVP